jgi:SAM-dependent methyltransferase
MSDVEKQRAYYTQNAQHYDSVHFDETSPLALAFLLAVLDMLDAKSVLDVGSGTGRVVRYVRDRRAGTVAVGVEPVEALRAVGHGNGLPFEALVDGDAMKLSFESRSVDVVCAFSMLHHIPHPGLAVDEMLRVAHKAIFICDANNFAQGSVPIRAIKRAANALGLWPLVDWIKTWGKGYIETGGDGISYSYSAFNSYEQIRRRCAQVHVLNLSGEGLTPYKTAGSVAILGLL